MRFRSLFLLSISLFSGMTYAASPMQYPRCEKTLTYTLSLSGADVGYFQRNEHWKGQNVAITSYGQISLLITKAKIKQQSNIDWSDQDGHYLVRSFSRNITGMMSDNRSATFSPNGHKSTITIDGQSKNFIANNLPILDGDGIATQMRWDLMQGKTKFDFNMLNGDEVSHYYFAVKGHQIINTIYGKTDTIKVQQVAKDRTLAMWFAPSLDYQLVKAHYKRNLLSVGATLQKMNNGCPIESTL